MGNCLMKTTKCCIGNQNSNENNRKREKEKTKQKQNSMYENMYEEYVEMNPILNNEKEKYYRNYIYELENENLILKNKIKQILIEENEIMLQI